LAEPLLVEAGAGVVLGEYTLERRVVTLDGGHSVVHDGADLRLGRVGLQMLPPRLFGHPEDAGAAVLVRVLRVGPIGPLGFQFGVLRLKSVGDVLEEDQPQDYMLVLRRVHVVAQRIGRGPEFRFKSKCGRSSHGSRFLFNNLADGTVLRPAPDGKQGITLPIAS